jgi:hypothetical protein
MRDAKNAASHTGQTINDVMRTAQGIKVALSIAFVIVFVGIWAGIAGGFLLGAGTIIILGVAAWYFWPMLKMMTSSVRRF